MCLLKNHKHWAGAADAWAPGLAADRDLKDQAQDYANGRVSRTRRDAAKIKNGNWPLPPKPLLNDFYERVSSMRVAQGRLEESQLRIQETQAQEVGARAMNPVHRALMRRLPPWPIWFELC